MDTVVVNRWGLAQMMVELDQARAELRAVKAELRAVKAERDELMRSWRRIVRYLDGEPLLPEPVAPEQVPLPLAMPWRVGSGVPDPDPPLADGRTLSDDELGALADETIEAWELYATDEEYLAASLAELADVLQAGIEVRRSH